jgi:hypothetical protein
MVDKFKNNFMDKVLSAILPGLILIQLMKEKYEINILTKNTDIYILLS